ncbi:PpiC-type peptidyl-prolyl cis-trans isomerase [Deinococcus proteolyticus MRP]|uniref:PpiC-type peptidyl-prolyl cis-trans isomerase n=1 Tax=Deinococcus proteolyticus (strain ATCC 35074 / DSM 20540 / JCM 6276 / NBRC 101906 / NCIMB 13154 / VKM Ac-1939 / CCM 2703 / MRP) TaxID=693977 RepID=F0RJM0_DEIPM|nr:MULTISPECIES: peptidylprolyl isomerase [Deinococcus]ADY26590.1 PpiC-type peptidyl-prolyl cis-trans isomerase [Deinococcus proteolyticus MRP]MCY1702714.1 peptidylprolyl isomerase [Deinococcus sp. SL84]
MLLALLALGALAQPAQAQGSGVQPTGPQPVSASGAQATADSGQPENDLLAIIGSGPGALRVTRADFDRAFRLAVGEVLNRQGLPLRDDLLTSFAPSRSQFFEQFIHDKQVEYLARQALPEFTYQGPPRIGVHSFAQPQGYADYLTGAGYRDEADYLSEMARRALLDAYRSELRTRFTFSDAAVESYYALNRHSFVQREEACARHILVTSEVQARDLRVALLAGADFALLARSQSRDPGSASRGGELGCLAPGETVAAFEATLFGAALGTPQVVQTDHGWHVVEVTERHAAGVIPPEQAAPQVRSALARSAAARLLNTQLQRVPTQLFPERVPVEPGSGPGPLLEPTDSN